jgi:hypothetical protein
MAPRPILCRGAGKQGCIGTNPTMPGRRLWPSLRFARFACALRTAHAIGVALSLDAQPAVVPAHGTDVGSGRSALKVQGGAGFRQLLGPAQPGRRIWPCVVIEHTQDGKGAAYILPAFGAAHEGAEHRVRLGSRISLAMQWDADAHLLLIDDGPDGKTFCLCRLWFVPDTRLRPGVAVLPPESARCEPFVVTGVSGREQVVVVLTEQPLPLDWMPTEQRMPARMLTEADFEKLLGLIRKLRPGSSTALATRREVYG